MLFNSLAFALFLPITLVVYWAIRPIFPRAQNILLILASYVFYRWWDWRFLILIVVSSAVDYRVRMVIDREAQHNSQWAAMRSIAAKIGCSAETLIRGFSRQRDAYLHEVRLYTSADEPTPSTEARLR